MALSAWRVGWRPPVRRSTSCAPTSSDWWPSAGFGTISPMTAVLIALADVGPAVKLEEQLNKAGVKARWDATQADGPQGGNSAAVVLVDADHLGRKLKVVADLWRD